MKIFCYILSIVLISSVAHAKGKKNSKKNGKKSYRQELKEAREAYESGIKAFLDPKDTNHDHSLSEDEFIANESDKAAAKKRFEEADKNHDGSLTKTEIAEMLGLEKTYEAARKQALEDRRKGRHKRK